MEAMMGHNEQSPGDACGMLDHPYYVRRPGFLGEEE